MEQQTQDTNTEQNTLTLNDVILMHNVIATVSRRGGFEAAEFEIVGALFNKLKALLPEQPKQLKRLMQKPLILQLKAIK
jgi:hypothetical protein